MGLYNYTPEEKKHLTPGDYRLTVISAEEKKSSTGKEMLVITLQPSGFNMKINHYIVDGQYFNANLTEFYDSFGIERGNTNLLTWAGAMGAGKLAEDKEGYMKVKYFLMPEVAKNLPEWEGEKPERQEVTSFEDFEPSEDEELPF